MNKKIISVLVAAGIVMGTTLPAMATPNTVNQRKAELQQNKDALKNAQKKKADLEEEIQKLDGKIEGLMRESNNLTQKISTTEKNIETTKKQLEEAKKQLEEQQAIYNQRVRAMYINGADSYLEVLLDAENFSDLISRVDMIKSIVTSDKKIIGELDAKKEEVNGKKVALDTEKQKLVALKSENENKLAKMNENKKEQEKVLAKLQQEESKYKDKVDDSARMLAEAQRAVQLAMASTTNSSRPSRGGGYTGGTSNSSSSGSSSNVVIPASGAAARAASIALGFRGVPYVWGGTTPSGFDCSGLVQYCFRQAGIQLPRDTYGQIGVGVPVSRDQLQVGDLIFPHTGHVGIYVGGGQMVHAPHTGDVVKVAPIYKFYTARRIR
ncbi:NlpC/P60 family protein [Haloimpatiens lingqiaonensis]|uniref:C40 family peptidase n=1 Tax=Haloimpatiens lingqiaonensis TaxID=1380675 RepID=UPI0010FDF4BC|nr:NlpC/P60 family protein [Haloimpatiens lingqiaonensis]